jgi:hypothetical protein
VKSEPEVKKHAEVPVAPKEAERQLSKKERKKKELEELEALLADFGVQPKESNDGQAQDESQGSYFVELHDTLFVGLLVYFYEFRLLIGYLLVHLFYTIGLSPSGLFLLLPMDLSSFSADRFCDSMINCLIQTFLYIFFKEKKLFHIQMQSLNSTFRYSYC